MLLRTLGVSILAWMLVTAGESKAVQSKADVGPIEDAHDDVWSDYHLLKSDESDNSDEILNTEDNPLMQDLELMDYDTIEEIKEMLTQKIPLMDNTSDNDMEEGYNYQLLNSEESEDLYEPFSSEENTASRNDYQDGDINNSDIGEGYDYQILNTDETNESVSNDANTQDLDVIDYEVVEEIGYLESNLSPLKDDAIDSTHDLDKTLSTNEEKESSVHNHEIMDYDGMDETEEIFKHKDKEIESNLILKDFSSIGDTRDNIEGYRSQTDVVLDDGDIDEYDLTSVLGGEIGMYEEIKIKINFLENLMKAHQGVNTKAVDLLETALQTLDRESLVPFEDNLNSVRGLIEELGDKIDSSALGYIRDVLMKAELFLKDAMVKLDVLERADVEYRKEDDEDGRENAAEMIEEFEAAIVEFSSNKDSPNAAEIIKEAIIESSSNTGGQNDKLEEAIAESSSNEDSNKHGIMGTNEEPKFGEFAPNGIGEDISKKAKVEEIMDDLNEVISDFMSHDIKNDKHSINTEQLLENKMDRLISSNHEGDQMNAEKLDRRISPKFKHLFDKVKGESNPFWNDGLTPHHHEFGSSYQPRSSLWRVLWLPALAGAVLLVVLAALLGYKLYERRRAIAAYAWDGNFHSELVNENYDGGVCNKLK